MNEPFRRIVTGHTPAGKAVIESDTTLNSRDMYDPSKSPQDGRGGSMILFRSEGFPASNNAPFIDLHGTSIPLTDPVTTSLRIVDIAPHGSSPMHRTISLDFGVVLKGEVVLELDDGVETTAKESSVFVQRGTIHAWHNRTDQFCRMLFVLMPSEKVKVQETGEEFGTAGFKDGSTGA